jgi:hypothetical protein
LLLCGEIEDKVFLNHVTLTTGHCRQSPRPEVSDYIVKVIRPWLKRAIVAGYPIPMPGKLEGYSAMVSNETGLCIIIYAPRKVLYLTEKGEPKPILAFATAQTQEEQDILWPLMHKVYELEQKAVPPELPWCAAVLLPPLAFHLEAMDWIADFERCVAWAWITERVQLSVIK